MGADSVMLGMLLCCVLCIICSCFSSLRRFLEQENYDNIKKNKYIDKDKKTNCDMCE